MALTKEALELADVKGFAAPQARKRAARQTARARHRQFSRSDGAAGEGARRHRFQCRRHGHAHDRHARFRHGPCHAVRPGVERDGSAFRSRRSRCSGRQRSHLPIGGGTRRLEIADAQRHRDRRSRGQGRRERQGARRATCSRPPRPTSNSPTAISSLPAPTARSAIMELARETARRRQAAGRRAAIARRRITSATDRARRPSPTAATSPRSRSIPRPAWSRSSNIPASTISASSSIR